MLDGTIYRLIDQVKRALGSVAQSLQLAITGESIRNQALQNVLMKKGIFTETELQEAIGDEIKKINDKPEEKKKPEITKPTAEEVKKVDESKKSVAKKEETKK